MPDPIAEAKKNQDNANGGDDIVPVAPTQKSNKKKSRNVNASFAALALDDDNDYG